jgi:hypothetical protein
MIKANSCGELRDLTNDGIKYANVNKIKLRSDNEVNLYARKKGKI